MPSTRITIRLNEEETRILNGLLASWQKDGRVSTQTDALRRCILIAENHRRRSNRQPELKPTPGDIGGELRRGRPKKTKPTDDLADHLRAVSAHMRAAAELPDVTQIAAKIREVARD